MYVLSGDLIFVTDAGEQTLVARDCATFQKNVADGYHLINRSDVVATYLEMGSRSGTDACRYPDIDLAGDADGRYIHEDGTAFPP